MLSYEELWEREDAPSGAAWGLFGAADEVGTINRITPDRIRDAASLIKKGIAFSLDYPLDAFSPGVGNRNPPSHVMFQNNEHHYDDYLDRFFLQGSSHVDGLRHFSHPTHGFYNGVPREAIHSGSPTLGVNRWAERGIVGRGVLLDVERFLEEAGTPIEYDPPTRIRLEDLLGTAEQQSVQIKPGDILMIRTGWASRVLESRKAGRFEQGEYPDSPGLEQSHEILQWLWDSEIAVLGADNLAVEVFPAASDSPFILPHEIDGTRTVHTGMMHRILIPMLGMCLGEMWNLDPLAEDSADDGVWECFFVSKPLNVLGGVGSPVNALALK